MRSFCAATYSASVMVPLPSLSNAANAAAGVLSIILFSFSAFAARAARGSRSVGSNVARNRRAADFMVGGEDGVGGRRRGDNPVSLFTRGPPISDSRCRQTPDGGPTQRPCKVLGL